MRTITTPWDDDPLMLPAFIGCVRWALGDDELVARFREETGNAWSPGRTPMDRMVDRAVGAEHEFFQQFSDWIADRVFGRPE